MLNVKSPVTTDQAGHLPGLEGILADQVLALLENDPLARKGHVYVDLRNGAFSLQVMDFPIKLGFPGSYEIAPRVRDGVGESTSSKARLKAAVEVALGANPEGLSVGYEYCRLTPRSLVIIGIRNGAHLKSLEDYQA